MPLANRGLRDLIGRLGAADLLAELAVLDTGDDLAFPYRIAQLDVHNLEAPVGAGHDLDGCRADQVADDHDLLGDGGPLDRGKFDGHRGPGAASAAGGRTATHWIAAAVVDQNAGQADHGDDDDCDCSTHWDSRALPLIAPTLDADSGCRLRLPTATDCRLPIGDQRLSYLGLICVRWKSTSARR